MRYLLMLAMAIFIGVAACGPQSFAQVSEVDAQDAQSAILSAGSRAGRIAGIDDVPGVGVVNLNIPRSFHRSDSIPRPEEFRISAAKNAAGIRRMQKALRANPVTRAALADHGVAVNSIVGVTISSSGSLRLYILR
jgi:hypothetical protein